MIYRYQFWSCSSFWRNNDVSVFQQFTSNVRGPKVVIALRSSVFFWPHSLPSTSSKLLRVGIIWKEIICPVYWYINYSQCVKGIRVVGVEMGVPNCMQIWESVESWRWYWYRSGEMKLLYCASVPHKHLHFFSCTEDIEIAIITFLWPIRQSLTEIVGWKVRWRL